LNPAVGSSTFQAMEVSLFIPCLVDRFLPEIGEATADVLERMGHKVVYDSRQTCCGQPAYNSGHTREAAALARRFMDVFERAEAVVAPSGSCVSMVVNHYGDLPLSDRDLGRWAELRERVFELSRFLSRDLENFSSIWRGRAVVHHSCHFLREVSGAASLAPLLDKVEGLDWSLLPDAACCGFGGAFSARLPQVSMAMGDDMLDDLEATGVDTLVLADAGCILHLRGMLESRDPEMRTRILHYAQILAGEEQ
jgi:L-lactate dehydrogenase complex protein LldE